MLKLERKSRDGEVNLLINGNDSFFNRSLVVAFLLALGFHALFLLVFHVSPFKSGVIETLYPPVGVEADLPVIPDGVLAVADIGTAPLSLYGIPVPGFSQPSVPPSSQFLKTVATTYSIETDPLDNPFLSIEEDAYLPIFSVSVKKERKPINVLVSGVLAERGIIFLGVDAKNSSSSVIKEMKEPLRLVYDVSVDGRTGKVFWFEPKEPSRLAAVNRLGNEIILGMLFATGGNFVDGTVELEFSGGNR